MSILAVSIALLSQTIAPPAEASAMDFWVGKWTATGRSRSAPEKDEWSETKATNEITKRLDQKVIHEQFKMDEFVGESWSVYNPRKKIWQQTWVDNSGAYLTFEGGMQGDKLVLNQINIPPTAGFKMRMEFSNISKDSFDWNWQRSKDGETWETQWELHYKRAT